MAAFPMNLQFFAQEKTEKATPKKRQEAREKGQVAKSPDVSAAMILLFGFLFLFMFGGYFQDRLLKLFTLPLTDYLLMDMTELNVMSLAARLVWDFLLIVAPFMLIAVVIGVFAHFIQFGFLFSTKPLEPKLEKIDPIQGAKRILSLRSLVEMIKSILKLSAASIVTFYILLGQKEEIAALSTVSISDGLQYIAGLTAQVGLTVAFLLVLIGFLDYLYQRYEHEKNLRMSKQDIKDEHKKTEGDPLIKAKIKEKQRQMAMRRMMSEVPKADVIITNPTHYAIALKYEAAAMTAPIIIAKGKDYIALKIKEKAKEHQILTMENKPLAQALYHQSEIGDTVPEDLYQAVAEVLAYVYRLQGKTQ